MRARLTSSIGAVVLVVASVGCGGGNGGEETFSAERFITEANAGGAGLELGAPLESTRPDTSLYSVELVEETPAEPKAARHQHGGGTLTVTGGEEQGAVEFERCESAVSLICFRAANVVLFFEDDLEGAEVQRLTAAVQGMAGE